MSRTLDLGLLRTLVAIADLGGFARAGQRVNLSQSAVSLQMRRLEENVCAQLFVRNGRRMVLTEEAQNLLRYARRILALNEEACSAIAGTDISGPVRFGTIQDLTEELLSEILGQFARVHSRVRLEVMIGNSQELHEALASGRLDLALLAGKPSRVTPLFRRERLIWIGSEDCTLPSEEPIPLVLCTEPCRLRETAIALLDEKQLTWRLAFSSPSLSGIKAALRAGLGITLRGTGLLGPGLAPLDARWRLGAPRHLDIVLARSTEMRGSSAADALEALIRKFAADRRSAVAFRFPD